MGEQLTDDQLQQLQDEQDAAAAAAAQQPVQVAQPSQGAAVPAIDANAPLYAQVAQQDAQKQALEAPNANPQVAIAPPKPAEAQVPTAAPVVLPSAPAASPKPSATAAPVAPGATAVQPLAIAMRQAPVATPRQFTAVSLPSTAEQTRAQIPGQTSTPGAAPGETASTGIAQPSALTMPTISRPAALDTPSQAVSLGKDKDDDPLVEKTEKDQAEQARLQKSGSGISQIFKPVDEEGNPTGKQPGFWKKFGGVLARVGDVAGSTLFPSVMMSIPGTELHHRVLMNQQNQRVGIDLAQQKAQQDLDTQDQADDIAAQNATKVPVTNPVTGQTYFIPQKDVAKFLGTAVTTQGHIKTAADRAEEKLGEAGLKHDDDGNIVPVEDDQLPPKLKSDIAYRKVREDLMGTQQELTEAKTATEKAKNDPNSPAYQLAVRRLAVAQQNANAAQTRATAYIGNYLQMAYNTGLHGETLAGAPVISNDAGDQSVVGSRNAGSATKNQSGAAQFNDVHGSLDSLEASARALVAKGEKPNSMIVAAALAEPKSSFKQWLQGAAAKHNLSSEQRAYVQNLVAAKENIQGLRKSAGGIATDSAVNNLLQMLPNASTPDLGYFLGQTGQIRATAERIGKGATVATGGLSVRGQGTANQTVSRAGRIGSRQQPDQRPDGATMKVPGSDGKMHWSDGKKDLGVAP